MFAGLVTKLPQFPFKKFLTGMENSKNCYLFNLDKNAVTTFNTYAKKNFPIRFACAQLDNAKVCVIGGFD